jgi:peptide/nickel transport system permease protein
MPLPARAASTPPNWPLILGGCILAIVTLLAVAGPQIAPRNPLERVAVVRTDTGPVGPPFPLFTPGFPLGSDRFGRDMLSRLIWAVQPTMIMVVSVALVRLVVGVTVGMAAGWAEARTARLLDALVGAALAVPTLIVALGVIAAVGIERGLPAFIAGLALTGWVETARVVSAATRAVKNQPFAQAAVALGAPDGFILARHVLRHVTPLLAMLLVFEISSTLMLAVALGFLGYYIGGGVWVWMDGDSVPIAQRATEYPELGQMLATSLDRVLDPRPMVLVGATIFVAILGFNLFGEGLRRRASEPAVTGGPLDRIWRLFERTLTETALGRTPRWARTTATMAAVVLAIGGAGWWWQAKSAATAAIAPPAATPLPAPGGHPWPAERADAAGTLAASWNGGDSPAVVWTYAEAGELSGGPVVAADGTIFLASRESLLVALGAGGQERWRATLPAPAFGSPALGADGTVYVADAAAGLSAFSPAGEQRWRFQSTTRRDGTSGPVVGADGTIYYTTVDRVQAVRPDGSALWVSDPSDDYLEVAPRLSPAGDIVFLKDMALSAATGKALPVALGGDEAEFSDPGFFSGADGGTYFRFGHVALEWRLAEAGAETLREVSWDAARATTFFPADAGASAARTVWLLYSTPVADTRLVWIRADGTLAGNQFFPQRRARVIGVAADATVFLCAVARNGEVLCGAFTPSSGALWQTSIGRGGDLIGGALTGDRIYVVTSDGVLHALGS